MSWYFNGSIYKCTCINWPYSYGPMPRSQGLLVKSYLAQEGGGTDNIHISRKSKLWILDIGRCDQPRAQGILQLHRGHHRPKAQHQSRQDLLNHLF